MVTVSGKKLVGQTVIKISDQLVGYVKAGNSLMCLLLDNYEGFILFSSVEKNLIYFFQGYTT